MTRLEAYKRHFTAVADTVLSGLPRNSRKIILIWNRFNPTDPIAPGGSITGAQLQTLISGLRAKIAVVQDSDLEVGARCPLGCLLFREPDENGVVEVAHLAGGIDLVQRVDGQGKLRSFFVDRDTLDEALFREYP